MFDDDLLIEHHFFSTMARMSKGENVDQMLGIKSTPLFLPTYTAGLAPNYLFCDQEKAKA